MAITIDVSGVNLGGGNQNHQPPTNPTPPTPPSPTPASQQTPTSQPTVQPQQQYTGGQPTPNSGNQQPPVTPTPPPTNPPGGQNPPQQPSQPTQYQRPDFTQYSQSQAQGVNSPLPTSDRLVNDVRAEMSRRGIILVPGTQNFSTMLNTMQQNQRASLVGQIDNQYERKMSDIDNRKDALMYEIKSRLDLAKDSELSTTNDPIQIARINKRYDHLLDKEIENADQYFAGQYDAVEQERKNQIAEAEQRLTEAIQRLTEELSQGNKDSYLNNLRDKYKEQIWRRDNAATEGEVREASREASKIQERMQRAMGGGMSPATMRWMGAIGTSVGILANTSVQSAMLSDQQTWGLGLEQASSVLNGNAFQAVRHRNAYENQQTSMWFGAGGAVAGALAGAAIGSAVPLIGTIVGGVIGGILGGAGGTAGAYYLGGNRERLLEDRRVQAADLWRQEEHRVMQFNDLAMLTRGRETNVEVVRNWYALGGVKDFAENKENQNTVETSQPRALLNKYGTATATTNAFDEFAPKLNLYDLGYTAPEFAQQAARRIKQRGFVDYDSVENALYSDALERVFSMNSGTLGQLSAYDRFGKNNANQDFANLAVTLDTIGTTGMRQGAWARSDEFAGYMTQLQGQQRGTFLTVDNERAGRQIATGQKVFGDKFGAEALQGIQQVNNTIQNPKGGFAQTLLYDVIQEKVPETRGRIDKIEQVQYGYLHPEKQNEIQQEYQRRIQSIYGGVDTTAGYLAAKEVWGIQNPNVMMPIVKQLSMKGGMEAIGLEKANQEELVKPISEGGYTPEVSKRLNIAADNQMRDLLKYSESLVSISRSLLNIIKNDTNQTLKEAVDAIHGN